VLPRSNCVPTCERRFDDLKESKDPAIFRHKLRCVASDLKNHHDWKSAARLQIDLAAPSNFALHKIQSAACATRVIFHLAPGKISNFSAT
jgi:hypothetical protein